MGQNKSLIFPFCPCMLNQPYPSLTLVIFPLPLPAAPGPPQPNTSLSLASMMHKLSAKISSATPERSEMLTRSLTQNVGLVLAVTPRKQ